MPASIGRTPFVGREQELAALHRCLDAAQRGQGQLVLVGGEPGVGKTRLLAEFAEGAKAEGWQVLAGRAYDSQGMPPYLPFSEALRDYVRTAPLADLRAQLDGAGPEVALLAPDIHRRLPDLPTSAPASPEEQRYRLFESVRDFLRGIPGHSEARGLVLILDDLHWADKATLLLLGHLARRLDGAPLLVATACRTVELNRAHPLTELLADLRREGLGERLSLGPLASAELAALVEGITGGRAAPAVVEAIERHTDGNPFFIGEVVRDLQAEGRDLTVPEAVAIALGVPEGVREVIDRRLARLSAATNELLQMASVLGDGFSFQELQVSGEGEGMGLLDALDEAVAAGMLCEQAGSYQFSHGLIRQTLYEGLSLPRRQLLHRQAAETLERVHADNLGEYSAALARHYRLAGPAAGAEKAIGYSLRAGEAAEAVFAYEEAATHWDAALRIMEEHGADAERRVGLMDRLGRLVQIAGPDRYAEAISYWERALTLYEEMGQTERVAEEHCRLAIVLASADADTFDLAAAVAHVRAATPVLEHGSARASQISLYWTLAYIAKWTARTQEGLKASQRAMNLADRMGDERNWVLSRLVHGVHLVAAGRLHEGLNLLEHAWEVADRLNQTLTGYHAAFWRGLAAFQLGDPGDARAWLAREAARPRQAHAQATSRGQSSMGNLITWAALSGDLAEARRLEGKIGYPPAERSHSVTTFWQPHVAFWNGDWDRAESLWSDAREREQRAGNRFQQADFACWLAHVKHIMGDTAGAVDLYREALAIALEGSVVPIHVTACAELALLAAGAGHPQEARPHLEHCRQILAGGENWRGLAGRVALAEAVATAAEGELAEAEQRFERAIAIFRQYGLPWDEAEALHWWGRSLLAAGDRAAAAAKLDRAVEIYRSHEAGEAWVEHVLVDRRRAGGKASRGLRRASPAAPSYPDGLSAREVEVLRLVAAGKSNQAIADTLVISLNTVLHHMGHIFTKANAANRAEAATYAHRHGLIED